MFLTQKQISDITEILDRSTWMFIARFINPSLVPESIMKVLKRFGFKETQVLRYPHLALQFGLLSIYMKKDFVKQMSFDKLKQAIKAKKYLPLSQEEKYALQVIENRAFNDIKGLGNRISQGLTTISIEADKKKRHEYEEIIRDAGKKAIAQRESAKWMRSQIGDQTKNWNRDLDRIADYVLHEAYNEGRAIAIEKRHGRDALVFGRVHKDACKHCKRIYLKNEKTFEPRIFKLSEIRANGTNIGRKAKDWKSSLSPVHPYCRCFSSPNIPIYTVDGYRNISEIEIGDLVLTHKGKFRKVLKVFKEKFESIREKNITFIDELENEILLDGVTLEHPFFMSNGDLKLCKDLEIGNSLKSFNYKKNIFENVIVKEIETIVKSYKVGQNGFLYNLEVEEDHSYIANGIVTHNCDLERVPNGFVWNNKQRAFVPDTKRVNKYDFSNLIKVKKN